MITKTLSPRKAARMARPRRSEPYLRALAHAGVIDCYVTDTGRVSFPSHAITEQLRAYEQSRAGTADAEQ